MSGPIKVLLMLVVWFIYMLFGYKACIEPCCPSAQGDHQEQLAPPVQKEIKRYPLDFKWSDNTAFTNDRFAEYFSGITAGDTLNKVLEITGHYFDEETTPEGFENMGFARASEIRNRFFADISDERIRLKAKKLDGGKQEGYFRAANFKWSGGEVAKTVEELDDRIYIRFPFNSTEKELDASVDSYLDKLAKRISETGEKVQLTGHTDNKGTKKYNDRLSRKRAEKIRDILVSKGASKNQIVVKFRGMDEPIATNNTEEGRHENRRVEVKLHKK